MIISGRATLPAPRAEVFAAICDPAVLLAVVPGCEAVERVSDTEYRGRIRLRLPGLVGAYATSVRLIATEPPAYGAFEGRVEGRPGGIAGRASFGLAEAPDGGTVVEYEGRGVVNGPLALLDGRFVESLARSLVDEGLARLGERLAAGAPVPAVAAPR